MELRAKITEIKNFLASQPAQARNVNKTTIEKANFLLDHVYALRAVVPERYRDNYDYMMDLILPAMARQHAPEVPDVRAHPGYGDENEDVPLQEYDLENDGVNDAPNYLANEFDNPRAGVHVNPDLNNAYLRQRKQLDIILIILAILVVPDWKGMSPRNAGYVQSSGPIVVLRILRPKDFYRFFHSLVEVLQVNILDFFQNIYTKTYLVTNQPDVISLTMDDGSQPQYHHRILEVPRISDCLDFQAKCDIIVIVENNPLAVRMRDAALLDADLRDIKICYFSTRGLISTCGSLFVAATQDYANCPAVVYGDGDDGGVRLLLKCATGGMFGDILKQHFRVISAGLFPRQIRAFQIEDLIGRHVRVMRLQDNPAVEQRMDALLLNRRYAHFFNDNVHLYLQIVEFMVDDIQFQIDPDYSTGYILSSVIPTPKASNNVIKNQLLAWSPEDNTILVRPNMWNPFEEEEEEVER